MRGPKPPAIALSDVERQELDALTRRHATPQQLALRARIVLAAAAGANNGQIARQLQVSVNMVRRWRERWRVLQAASLEDLPVVERLTDAPARANPRALRMRKSARSRRWPVKRPPGRSGPSASGPAANWRMKSNSAA
jgi:putative transposase